MTSFHTSMCTVYHTCRFSLAMHRYPDSQVTSQLCDSSHLQLVKANQPKVWSLSDHFDFYKLCRGSLSKFKTLLRVNYKAKWFLILAIM